MDFITLLHCEENRKKEKYKKVPFYYNATYNLLVSVHIFIYTYFSL